MRRNLLTLVAVIAALCLASSAWAQTPNGGGEGGGGEHADCFCTDDSVNSGAEFCVENRPCAQDPDCTDTCGIDGPCVSGACTVGGAACTGGQEACAEGEVCMDGTNSCGMAVCVPGCPEAHGLCIDTHVFGSHPDPIFPHCPHLGIPTLGQWGVIFLGFMLLTAAIVMIRRGGLPTSMTASLLVLTSAGLIALSVSYTDIQSNRICGESDVAVEFVGNLLDS